MTYRYRDKLTGRTVVLDESHTDFVALGRPDDAETLGELLGQNLLSVSQSSNNDGVFILKVNSDAESLRQIQATIAKLKSSDAIDAVAPAVVDAEGITRYALPDRVVVQFKTPATSKANQVLKKHRAKLVRQFRSPGLYEVETAQGISVFDLIASLNSEEGVQFAEPSYYGVNDQEIRSIIATPPRSGSDAESLTDLPWNVMKIAAPAAWTVTTGQATIVVGVVDGWPDAHDALAGKFHAPLSDELVFTADRTPSSHATNICGLIAADQGRIAGIAPGTRVLPLVVNLRSQSYGERADAIRWAAQVARLAGSAAGQVRRLVLSCSWKVSGDVAVIRAALLDAVEAGVMIVFSAGNDGVSGPHYPSDYSGEPGALGDGIISVAATDENDRRASYSNYSAKVDLLAPGGDGLPFDERDILCADLANSYAEAAGTSIAAPHVAAVAALVLSIRPNLTPKELKALLRKSVDDVSAVNAGMAGLLGTGRLNAAKALAEAQLYPASPNPATTPIVDPDPDPEPEPDPVADPPEEPVEGAESDGPSVRLDTVTADTDVSDQATDIRMLMESVRERVDSRTGWLIQEVRVGRGADSITLHFG